MRRQEQAPTYDVRVDSMGTVWVRQGGSPIQSTRERVAYLSWSALESLRGPLTLLVPQEVEND